MDTLEVPAARTEGDAAAMPLHAPPDAAAAATNALVAELRGVIADLRQDRDHWREQGISPCPTQAARALP